MNKKFAPLITLEAVPEKLANVAPSSEYGSGCVVGTVKSAT